MGKAAGSWLAIGFVVGLALVLRRASEGARPAAARRSPASPGRRERGGGVAPDLSDDALAARVRERVDIPPDVEVEAEDGAVVLFGRVPRYLARMLLERVSAVEGVTVVEDRLTPVDFVQPGRPPGPPDRP